MITFRQTYGTLYKISLNILDYIIKLIGIIDGHAKVKAKKSA
jgi:hypothetical protein